MKTADEYADMAEYHIQQALLASDKDTKYTAATIAATYAALAQTSRIGDVLDYQAKAMEAGEPGPEQEEQ